MVATLPPPRRFGNRCRRTAVGSDAAEQPSWLTLTVDGSAGLVELHD
jgi:hypothetical protein